VVGTRYASWGADGQMGWQARRPAWSATRGNRDGRVPDSPKHGPLRAPKWLADEGRRVAVVAVGAVVAVVAASGRCGRKRQ